MTKFSAIKRTTLTREEQIARGRRVAKLGSSIDLGRVRRAAGLSQAQVAGQLKIRQENVSRIERQGDIRLSTLAAYVYAAGGDLDITIRLPSGEAIAILEDERIPVPA